jgi:hypothetical protein
MVQIIEVYMILKADVGVGISSSEKIPELRTVQLMTN